MAEETFSDLGRVEAIAKLYEGTPYKPFQSSTFETDSKCCVTSHSRTFMEGIDFDLIYFPLKHLGYKCATAVTGELYAELSARFNMNITASGGVSTLDDVKRLADMNMYGAILGKAIYTGNIDLKVALEVAR